MAEPILRAAKRQHQARIPWPRNRLQRGTSATNPQGLFRVLQPLSRPSGARDGRARKQRNPTTLRWQGGRHSTRWRTPPLLWEELSM